MKNLICALLLLVILPAAVYSQVRIPKTTPGNSTSEPQEPFLYLFDGTLLREGEFTGDKGLFTDRFYYSDGSRIQNTDIKFYQDENLNYYGNYRSEADKKYNTYNFALRKEKGTFSLYASLTSSPVPGGVSMTYFYARGFEDLKPLNYLNLKEDLGVFPNNKHPEEEKAILGLIEKGQTRKRNKRISLFSGLAVFSTGLVIAAIAEKNSTSQLYGVTDPKSQKLQRTGILISTAGLGGMITSLVIPKPEKAYIKALKHYNRFY